MTSAETFDYTDNTWSAAFAALCACLKQEYVFTEWKGIHWDALQARFTPQMNEADARGDRQGYYAALREFLYQVPDANLRLWGDDWDLRKRALGGTLGLDVTALDDGGILVSRVAHGQAAEQAGMQPGAQILTWNDKPIALALGQTHCVWGEHPTATTTQVRLEQCLALTRMPIGSTVRVQFRNPRSKFTESVTLVCNEYNSDAPPSPSSRHANSPIHARVLESGIGYLAVHALPKEPSAGFWDSTLYEHVQESLLRFSRDRVHGLVIDLRNCVGSNHALAAHLAGFFHSQPIFYALAGYRDTATARAGQLKTNPRTFVQIIPQDIFWRAPVVVIVNSATRGAAEGLAYAIHKAPHSAVVGMTSTGGAFGTLTENGVGEAWMPEGYSITFAREAGLNQDGIVQIESNRFGEGGVRPNVRVPRNQRTFEMEFLAGVDVVLTFAEQTCVYKRQSQS